MLLLKVGGCPAFLMRFCGGPGSGMSLVWLQHQGGAVSQPAQHGSTGTSSGRRNRQLWHGGQCPGRLGNMHDCLGETPSAVVRPQRLLADATHRQMQQSQLASAQLPITLLVLMLMPAGRVTSYYCTGAPDYCVTVLMTGRHVRGEHMSFGHLGSCQMLICSCHVLLHCRCLPLLPLLLLVLL